MPLYAQYIRRTNEFFNLTRFVTTTFSCHKCREAYRERKKAIHENSLAKAAVPHVKRMIEEIEQAAAHGSGRCDYILEIASDADTEMLGFACDYLRMEGYTVETSEDSSSSGKNKKGVVIRWLD